jgi:cellulose biosynthesis protein BcsQ
MSKVISIANTAGGTGKTTIAHGLATAFVEYGKKTLLIDLDPKADLTFRLGRENARITAIDFFNGAKLTPNTVDTTDERFDFIGADIRLASPQEPTALKNFLETLSNDYSLIVLDLPSSISPPLGQAASVTDLFIIPMQQRLHDLRGALQISSIAKDARVIALQIGVGQPLSQDIELLDCAIELNVEIEKAQNSQRSVLTFAKESTVAENFREATYSILEELNLA